MMVHNSVDIENDVVVTVLCTVYNHEKYLRECLEGIVKQKTNFKFEAIVHDDASTDNSQAIIKEYAIRYPDIIKPILQKENQYSKHDGSLTNAINPNIKGQYIAICEGDDFWIDANKLQLQVDFMDRHPDVVLCFHTVKILSEKYCKRQQLYSHLREGYVNANTIIEKWTVPTCSAVIRKEIYLSVPYDRRFIVGDNVIWLTCCSKGKVYCMDNVMATYRRSTNGWTLDSFGNDKVKVLCKYKEMLLHFKTLQTYFPNVASLALSNKIKDYYARIFVLSLLKDRSECLKYGKEGFIGYGFKFIFEVIQRIWFYVKIRMNSIVK